MKNPLHIMKIKQTKQEKRDKEIAKNINRYDLYR